MTKKRFGVGLVVGALAGLVAGLLTAPKSGKETRADIKRKAGAVGDEAKRKVNQATTDVKRKVDEVKDKAQTTADDARGRAMDKVEEVKDKADELRTRAENAVEGAKAGFNNPKKH